MLRTTRHEHERPAQNKGSITFNVQFSSCLSGLKLGSAMWLDRLLSVAWLNLADPVLSMAPFSSMLGGVDLVTCDLTCLV